MRHMKSIFVISSFILAIITLESNAQVSVYRSGGGEVIFSGADVRFNAANSTVVNTNARFTLFLHIQQMLNLDLNKKIGFYTGAAIRNVGLIMEDRFQYLGFDIDDTHDNWDKEAKVKRRSYSLGFPLALKLGAIDKHYFLYAGGEYEWMFHYKQKLFLDDIKTKENGWGNARVTTWNPSLFVGFQFPGGLNLKFKYYMKDFLNHDFVGTDFNHPVDYSQFESTGIWYISIAMVINKKQLKKMLENSNLPQKSAYR